MPFDDSKDRSDGPTMCEDSHVLEPSGRSKVIESASCDLFKERCITVNAPMAAP